MNGEYDNLSIVFSTRR